MLETLTIDNFFTLAMLVMLQIVLGFDNLLYISLESRNAPEDKQSYVRKLGIGLAVGLRIVLLFALVKLIAYFQDPIFSIDIGFIKGTFNIHSLIVLLGGVFILYTALKEIWHMLALEEDGHAPPKKKSTASSCLDANVVPKVRQRKGRNVIHELNHGMEEIRHHVGALVRDHAQQSAAANARN